MTQYARPASDISAGSWTDEGTVDNDGNLYTSLDETSQDGDSSYVNGASGAGTFEVKLSSLTDPTGNTGHIVHVYAKGVGSGGPEKVDLYLYEATTLIATIANNWAPGRSAYADVNYTLGTTEADAISDYTDLRVRVVEDTIGGGEAFRVTQIYMECPDAAGTQVNKDLQAVWDITELVNKDLAAQYDLLNLVNKDLQADWDIYILVNKDLQANWDITELVSKDIQAVWDMEGSVSKDLQAVWDLLNLVNKDIEGQYDITNLVNKDLQAKWDMRQLANKDIQMLWDMEGSVSKNLQAVWDLYELVNKDTQLLWGILNLVNKDLEIQWDITELVNKDIEAVWDILASSGVVNKDMQMVYDILSIISANKRQKTAFPFWF